ncbi:MAG TPA: hypothetical protein VIA62_09235 [Thermoanaerobaculia bacterium]|jgi:hypothetical protein|nr:hypothetical protein [Thermoanaerobaculia bacterium]
MDRSSWLVRLALGAALFVSPAIAQTAQQGTPAQSKTVMAGETLNVQLFNVTPTTAVTLAFQGLRFNGPARPKPGSEAAVAGVTFQGSTLVFSPPQRSVPVGQFSTVAFSVPIQILGQIRGTATVHKPVVVTLATALGFVSTQDGPFTIPAGPSVVPAATPGNP